ncbi:HD-GYP domain-containing protein [Pseudobacteroides cellulosolvens]|uniref:Metal dependent phosphohydrolase n=1 Tax=Pseudobacteroides cellulosolvens ATCC 35603 = DSM 2933 TaxID=398512 RepID=A0A0L6JV64_9FIRM|nr:HD-GYP domain-containing protein [Pseudobacteroides cellulosolvens]KNY29624.1 metal dependent phosphohydrolase [Pseudobacteroides cellulosolvens ATCC 35603 = DSM 2933]
MDKYNIRIAECKPGMVIAKDVYNDKGAIFMKQGTVLTDFIIDKLVINSIEMLWVTREQAEEDESPNDSPSVKETKKEYVKRIEKIKTLFENVLLDDAIEQKVTEISASIINSDKTTGDLLRCIRSLKSIGDYMYTHSLNVASVCCLIGNWMKLGAKEVEEITVAGLLHDIGKAKVPKEILNKKADLTNNDIIEIKKHTQYGYEILKDKTGFSEELCKGVLMHHEREDGSGYPNGVKGDKINLIAKIISVADLYSIITLDRVYKRTDTPFSVFEIFESSASQKFDTLTVFTLISNVAMYFIGDNVRLSNGMEGQIFYIDNEFVSRPLIKLKDGNTFDLRSNRNVKIVEIL